MKVARAVLATSASIFVAGSILIGPARAANNDQAIGSANQPATTSVSNGSYVAKPTTSAGSTGNASQAASAAPAGAQTAKTAATLPAKDELEAILDGTSNGGATADGAQASGSNTAKILLKPGQPISINTETEDVQPTDDVELARAQVAKYADSPEASFILAVALTRTSHVEEALQEVRRARRLAKSQGGADYFDKMIAAYEKMLETAPDDNRIRYSLAWAYYMKAYLLSQSAKSQANAAPAVTAPPGNSAAANATGATPAPANTAAITTSANGKTAVTVNGVAPAKAVKGKKIDADVANQVLSMLSPKLAQSVPAEGKVTSQEMPHLPSAIETAAPSVAPQVKKYYEAALKNLDDLLARKPDDVRPESIVRIFMLSTQATSPPPWQSGRTCNKTVRITRQHTSSLLRAI